MAVLVSGHPRLLPLGRDQAQGRAKTTQILRLLMSGVARLRVGDRDLPRQHGDQLGLGAQLQMQIQKNDQADADPDVEDKVDAAADPDQLRELRGARPRWPS